MNDTHGVTGQGWYAFDLDGTLAVYDRWQGIDHIGEPVKPMVELMKKLHAEGKIVKILTARVAPRANTEYKPNPYYDKHPILLLKNQGLFSDAEYKMLYGLETWDARAFITDWCRENLGFLPEITHEKDHLMLELYDDRVKQVVPNKGILVEDVANRNYRAGEELFADNMRLQRKVDCKFNGFMAGFMLAATIVSVLLLVLPRFFKDSSPDRERFQKAHDAICELLQNWPDTGAIVIEAKPASTNGWYTAAPTLKEDTP